MAVKILIDIPLLQLISKYLQKLVYTQHYNYIKFENHFFFFIVVMKQFHYIDITYKRLNIKY